MMNKFKKMIALSLVVALVMGILPLSYANKYFESNTVTLYDPSDGTYGTYYPVNLMMGGKDVITDVPGILFEKNKSTRTLVPISFIVDEMGGTIQWDGDTKEVTIVSESKTIVMQIGNSYASVNGTKTQLPDGIAPIILTYNDLNKTYVPVKFISDQLGLDVSWISETRTVAINKQEQTLNNVYLNYKSQFPEIRLKVTDEVDATSFMVNGSDVGGQDKIIVDLQNTVFDLTDKSLVKNGVGTYTVSDGIFGIDRVEITQTSTNPATTRATLFLDQKNGYEVVYDKSTSEMVIRLMNTVNAVNYETLYGTDTIVINTSVDDVMHLMYNPMIEGDQIYIDVIGARLKADEGIATIVPVNEGKVENYSYSQLDTSKPENQAMYGDEALVTRVAIALNEEVTYDDIYIEANGTEIYVFISQNPLNNFEYVKLNDSASNMVISLFEDAEHSLNYVKDSALVTLVLPKRSTDINIFEYAVNDNIIQKFNIEDKGDNYIIDIYLSDNTTFKDQSTKGTIAIAFSNETIKNSDYKDILVVIDAGHGGHDPGATGTLAKEKDLALKASLKLADQLKQLGFKTYLTRSTDEYVDLYDRADIANDLKATLFVSIHINAHTNTDASGVEVLYNSDDMSTGKGLAQDIQDYLVSDLKAVDRGIVKRPNLVVLRVTTMPAVLCELGFISNPSDQQKLMTDSYLDKSANAIVKGIVKFIDR